MEAIKIEIINLNNLTSKIISYIEDGKNKISNSIDTTIVETYWKIGRDLIEEEQNGEDRAVYGKEVINTVSNKLSSEYKKGYSARNLRRMRKFYMIYPIWTTVSSKLSWSHYLILIQMESKDIRAFYEFETISNNWSTRELDRQRSSLLYERLALSKDKEKILELAKEGQIIRTPDDVIKDPYVLEFTGLKEMDTYSEYNLESKLIDHLQDFLLELGKGFSFVKRQKRISFGEDHFYIDLVFYNYILKCFVLIDLKVGKLKHQDVGQMQMYVNYYKEELKNENDNNPIGIILCAEKNDAVVKYTLGNNTNSNSSVFASKYQTYLPTEKELINELIREKQLLEIEKHSSDKND